MIEELRIPDFDTRNEVLAAYDGVLQKLNNQTATPEDPEIAAKKATITEIAKEKTDDYIKKIEQLKRQINDSFDELKEKCSAEHQKLKLLEESIALKEKEVEDLYGINVEANSLSALIFAQKNKTAAFEKEMKEWRQSFEQEVQQKRRDWQQEEQKYAYQRDIAKEKDRTLAETAKRTLEQELTEMRIKYQQEIEAREARLLAGEFELQQFEELKAKLAKVPQQLDDAVARAEENVTEQLTMKFNYEAQLYQKEIKILQQTIAGLESKITTLEGKLAHFDTLKNSFNQLAFLGDNESH